MSTKHAHQHSGALSLGNVKKLYEETLLRLHMTIPHIPAAGLCNVSTDRETQNMVPKGHSDLVHFTHSGMERLPENIISCMEKLWRDRRFEFLTQRCEHHPSDIQNTEYRTVPYTAAEDRGVLDNVCDVCVYNCTWFPALTIYFINVKRWVMFSDS